MSSNPFEPQDPDQSLWDVIVIGTGMGGSTLGMQLSKLGHKVLFVEKGQFLHAHVDGTGSIAKGSDTSRLDGVHPGEDTAERLRRGHWPRRIQGDGNFGHLDFYAPMGCGSGGTTTLYAAALERFRPCDFAPRASFPQAPDSTLPERWPISYEELRPYYEQAERLFRVAGSADPLAPDVQPALREPPPLSERDQHLFDSFKAKGLNPYRIHVGYEYRPGCTECGGHLCPKACKSDAARICLVPALSHDRASLLTECEVTRLEAGLDGVRAVHCLHRGAALRLRGKVVVLAAGAYMSPLLLLRSASPDWPDGLANRSGLVGRNLMVHVADYIALTPLKRLSAEGPQKTLAFNDFYEEGGEKIGSFQAVGAQVTPGQIMQFIRYVADRDPRWWVRLAGSKPIWWRKLSSPIIRLVALLMYHAFYVKNAAIWGQVVEDLPYHDNRIVLDEQAANGFRFEYRYTDELKARVMSFRRKLSKAIAPHRAIVLSGENNLNFGHVCGTCRFGDDPASSVLNRDNRCHDVENLYVVDASFFPSSGGTNPSLTIAANALRVAGTIDRQLRGMNAGSALGAAASPLAEVRSVPAAASVTGAGLT